MNRTLTEDGSGNINFQERATDVDGDTISVDRAELDAIDGATVPTSGRTPSWLNYTTTFNAGSPSEILIDVSLVVAQLSQDTTYTFLFEVSDANESTQRTVTLNVNSPSSGGGGTSTNGGAGGSLGNTIYWGDFSTNKIHQNDLSTPFDLSAYSLDGNLNPSSGYFLSIVFNSDGTECYVLNGLDDAVSTYTLGTAYDVNTASFVSTDSIFISPPSFGNPRSLAMRPDGSRAFIVNGATPEIRQLDLSSPYDFSSVTLTGTTEDSSPNISLNDPRGMTFKSDGSKVYVGDQNGVVGYADLNTPWDITTNTSFTTINVSAQDNINAVWGVSISEDGTKFYIFDVDVEKLIEFDLSTPWDLSSRSEVNRIGLIVSTNGGGGLTIN